MRDIDTDHGPSPLLDQKLRSMPETPRSRETVSPVQDDVLKKSKNRTGQPLGVVFGWCVLMFAVVLVLLCLCCQRETDDLPRQVSPIVNGVHCVLCSAFGTVRCIGCEC